MLTKTRKRKEAVPYVTAKAATRAARLEPGLDFGDLENHLGFLLRMAYMVASRHFAHAMDRLDLTQKQTGVLWLIGANGGASQTAIANELGMDRASMMAIVDRLEERELVTRERSQHDGRRQALFLTPKGRRLLSQASDALMRHETWLAAPFTPEELTALKALLKRVPH
jgi:DNA-binding MarR family transcriptional regulator